MKDNFDVHSWNTNRILESNMSDEDLKAKQKVNIIYNQLTNDFPDYFQTPRDKSLLRFSIASSLTELNFNNLNESEEKEYEVQYWVYRDDNYDDDYIMVKARSEEEALSKAKEEKYKGKNFKIVK
jgi:hypothetical protein